MNWICPVCGGSHPGAWICPDCGFDLSRDCERYPTLTATLPAGAVPAATLAEQRRQARERQAEERSQAEARLREREAALARREAELRQAEARLREQEQQAAQARGKAPEQQQAAPEAAPLRKRKLGFPVVAVAIGLVLFLLSANVVVAVTAAVLALLLHSLGRRVGAAQAARPQDGSRRSHALAALRAVLEAVLAAAGTFVLFTLLGFIPGIALLVAVIELAVYAVGRRTGRRHGAAEQA